MNTTEQVSAQELLNEYEALLRKHDWYFEYSDDHGVWSRGRAQVSRINSVSLQLKTRGLEEEAQKLFKKYAKGV